MIPEALAVIARPTDPALRPLLWGVSLLAAAVVGFSAWSWLDGPRQKAVLALAVAVALTPAWMSAAGVDLGPDRMADVRVTARAAAVSGSPAEVDVPLPPLSGSSPSDQSPWIYRGPWPDGTRLVMGPGTQGVENWQFLRIPVPANATATEVIEDASHVDLERPPAEPRLADGSGNATFHLEVRVEEWCHETTVTYEGWASEGNASLEFDRGPGFVC